MPKQRVQIPINTGAYQAEDLVDQGPFSSDLFNGYVDEFGVNHRIPGLTELLDTTAANSVDVYWWTNQAVGIAVSAGNVYKITSSSGSFTDVTSDTLQTSGHTSFVEYRVGNYGDSVFMANGGKIVWLTKETSRVEHGGNLYDCIKNHQAGTDDDEPGVGANSSTYWSLVGAGSGTAWADSTYYTSGVSEYLDDPDAPTSTIHLAVLDKYLIALQSDSTLIEYSAASDPLTWNAESVEPESQSDKVLQIRTDFQEIAALGTKTFEFLRNDGTTPFVPNDNAFIKSGGASSYSMVEAGDTYMYLDNFRNFVRVNGRRPEKISIPVSRAVQEYSSVNDCFGSVAYINGREFVVWTFPTDDATWAYDVETQQWSQWGDYDSLAAEYTRFRGQSFAYSPDWDMVLVGDEGNGKVYKMTTDAYTFDGDQLRFTRRTGAIDHGTSGMKDSAAVTFKLKRVSSVSEPASPQLQVRWRDNGSTSWSDSITIPLGNVGDTSFVYRLGGGLGRYYTRQWEVVMSDATPLSLVSMEEEVEVVS